MIIALNTKTTAMNIGIMRSGKNTANQVIPTPQTLRIKRMIKISTNMTNPPAVY